MKTTGVTSMTTTITTPPPPPNDRLSFNRALLKKGTAWKKLARGESDPNFTRPRPPRIGQEPLSGLPRPGTGPNRFSPSRGPSRTV